MSHLGENVDMTLEEENPQPDMILEEEGPQADFILEEEVPQDQGEKRKRGPTMCAKTSASKELKIQFWDDGRPKGQHRSEYTNWCNNLVKQKASILVESWDKFDKKEHKDEWWKLVKVKYLTLQFFILIIVHELNYMHAVILLSIRLSGTSRMTQS